MKDVDLLNTIQLITAKPVVYLINLSEKAFLKKKSKWLPKVRPYLWTETHMKRTLSLFAAC